MNKEERDLMKDLLRRLKGKNDDDGTAGVLARKKPPKYPFGPSKAKARPEAE